MELCRTRYSAKERDKHKIFIPLANKKVQREFFKYKKYEILVEQAIISLQGMAEKDL